MPTKKPSVKAYVSPEIKKAIVEMAKSPKTSVSKVAGKILNEAMKPLPNSINFGGMSEKEKEAFKNAFKSFQRTDTAIFNQVTGFDTETGDPDKLSNQFAKTRREELK